MWFLALFVAATSLRYFLLSPRAEDAFEVRSAAGLGKITTTRPPPVLAVASHNRPLLLLHVGGGVVAMVTGLFQFATRLRTTRPAIHRVPGRVYLGAVLIGSSGGLPLSYLALRHLPDPVRSGPVAHYGSFCHPGAHLAFPDNDGFPAYPAAKV